MTNQEIEKLIQEKRKQINYLNKEIEELKKQHSLLNQRYEVAIIAKRKCKKTTQGAILGSYLTPYPHKIYVIPQKAFMSNSSAKSYAYQLSRKIRHKEIKLNGKEYSHMAILDKTINGYQIIWTCM